MRAISRFHLIGSLTSIQSAVLAVQNMNACNAVEKAHDIEFKALEGSLNMMSKGMSVTISSQNPTDGALFFVAVLNDVLDL